MDYNERRKDTELGVASFDLMTLEKTPEQESIVSSVMYEGKERGALVYDAIYFPVILPKKEDDGHGGVTEVKSESKTGIVSLTLHQAKELSGNHPNPVARVTMRKNEVRATNFLIQPSTF